MAKYRALHSLFVTRFIAAGETFDSDITPGRNWEPLDNDARAAVQKVFAGKTQVLDAADRLDRRPAHVSAVTIPDDWQTRAANFRRGLAMRLGAQGTINLDDADSLIETELERRGTPVRATEDANG